MTRRGHRAVSIAAAAAAALCLPGLLSAATPYAGPPPPPKLWDLVFTPSLLTGPAPVAPTRAPETVQFDAAAKLREEDPAIQDKLEAIAAEESRNGPFSRTLADELVSLAGMYQARGEHDVALGLLERARQIVRFNDGLFSIEQAPMIEQAIESREALHEPDVAPVARKQLLELVRRNPSAPRVAEIYDTVADTRVEEAERYLTVGYAAPVGIALNSAGGRPLPSWMAWNALNTAQMNYGQAIRATVRHLDVDGPSLGDLEAGLMHTYFLQAQNARRFKNYFGQPYRLRQVLHTLGAASYERRLTYSRVLGDTDSEIARELLELGDWHLWFGDDKRAFDAYAQARELLALHGATPEQLERFFSPTTPVVLPAFATGYAEPATAAGYKGHIDVAIMVDAIGQGTIVDVTQRSPAASDSVVQQLKKHVEKGRFRPRLENGDWVSETLVPLRYYFSY